MNTQKWNPFRWLKHLFLNHPRNINESYFEHLFFAMRSGLKLVIGGLACILHSIFPFIFIDTASKTVTRLSNEFEQRRNK